MSDKFRKLHKDRQHLIRQCSSAVAEIQLRDKDIIENLCCDFANTKTEANDQRNFLKEDYEVLEEEKRHNDKLQEELRNLKLTKKALDGEYDKAKAESLPAGELEALRNFLQNISSDLDKNRQLCLQLDLQIKTKTESEEEMRKRKYEKELSKIEKLQFNTLQEVKHVESNTTTLKGESTLSYAHLNSASPQSRFYTLILPKNITEQNYIYQSEESTLRRGGIKMSIRKCRFASESYISGDNKYEEKANLERRLQQLRMTHEEKMKLNNTLQSHLSVWSYQTFIYCLCLNKIVEESLLKLEVKRLNEMLLKFADNVLLLENQRVDFHKAINEKNNDITSHMERLKNTLKQVNADKKINISKLQSTKQRIEKTENKYEVLMGTACSIEHINESYFVIKEKNMLLQQEHHLQQQIENAKLELSGMKNSLELINQSNQNLKKSLQSTTLPESDLQENKKLGEELKTLRGRSAFLDTQLAKKQASLENLEKDKIYVSKEFNELSEQLEDSQQALQEAEVYLSSQKEKIVRVTSLICKAEKSLAKSYKKELKSIHCQYFKEIVQNIYTLLGQVVSDHPTVFEKINELLTGAGLQPVSQLHDSYLISEASSKRSSISKPPSRLSLSSARSRQSKCSANSMPISVVNINMDGS
ncbi:Coiled-coil domain-containing protein 39 [Nymphon striatum]|nr:Coiled-coil domain-containing protein 39 [Nymphon striatum]